MVRHYKPKRNPKRPYNSCNEDDIDKTIEAVANSLSLRKAAIEFGVKRSTLSDQINLKHKKAIGRPAELTPDEETLLAEVIDILADWRYPVGKEDIALMVRDLMNAREIKNSQFRNNTPGDDWVANFIERNNLRKSQACNLKLARAAVDAEDINNFFDNYEAALAGVEIPPSNVFNFDETNFTDDPGKQWVVVRRGRKRTEKVQEHSKTSISVMWCGSADGTMLPPMVVYKAQNLYEGWCEGGPVGAVYDNSESGWFDSRTFQVWFYKIFLPHVETLEGVKVITGDNLASHFNPTVVQECLDKNIKFVMLHPNSTDKMQVLDVTVFRPMKGDWRDVLKEYRREIRRKGAIDKAYFPQLLSQLMTVIQTTLAENLITGFRTCGIYPIDRQEVLKKKPSTEDIADKSLDVLRVFSDTLVNLLEENRCKHSKPKPHK